MVIRNTIFFAIAWVGAWVYLLAKWPSEPVQWILVAVWIVGTIGVIKTAYRALQWLEDLYDSMD